MRKLLFSTLIVCSIAGHAQNLLANGGFDDRNICIEFRAGCAPEAWFTLPLTSIGISGITRNPYVSIVMENVPNAIVPRSFIYTKLLCDLNAGVRYRFRASLRGSGIQFEQIDVLTIPFEPNRNKNLLASQKGKFTITPAQKIAEGQDSWSEYMFEFTASGSEKYIIIGNFSKQPFPLVRSLPNDPRIIYDIDNISLLPIDSTILACREWRDNKTILYRNNSRHTINNFLDDEDPFVQQPEKIPEPPKKAIVVPVENDTLVIPDVLFKLNSAELNPKFMRGLDSLVAKIKTLSFKQIEVIGHTDSLGTHALNTMLSLHRAETVKKYLVVKLQYPTSSISANGKAALIPVASNKTAAGRQKNRRVEIVLIK